MASVSISCPSCSATDGVVRNGKSTAGHQRYLCSHCRKTWQLQFTYTASQSGRWSGGNKINYSACNWYKSSVAMNHFIGGKSGGSIYYKPIQCPTGYIMTGTRMYGIGDGVDEEHVDAYCCPFN